MTRPSTFIKEYLLAGRTEPLVLDEVAVVVVVVDDVVPCMKADGEGDIPDYTEAVRSWLDTVELGTGPTSAASDMRARRGPWTTADTRTAAGTSAGTIRRP